ncbi:MAG: DnaJ domain-containing protein [Candidatus Saccharimonadales bacterium]
MTYGKNDRFIDYYELLGTHPGAVHEEIRRAFMKLAKRLHPDAGGSLETMQLLNTAYATLRNDTKRKAYDLIHQFQSGTATAQYRYDTEGAAGNSIDDLTEEEIDDFVDHLFKEYSVKKQRPSLRTQASERLRFRRGNKTSKT